MDHKSNSARDLSDQMAEKCSETDPQDEKKAVETIQLGLRLGQYNFINTVLKWSTYTYQNVKNLMQSDHSVYSDQKASNLVLIEFF